MLCVGSHGQARGLVGCATDEDVDYVSVDDVGELIELLGEELNVHPEGCLQLRSPRSFLGGCRYPGSGR